MNNSIIYHETLARYFTGSPLYADPAQNQPNTRKLVELPWQQTKAEMWNEIVATLCDLRFVEAKCANGMVYGLLQDFIFTENLASSDNEKTDIIGNAIWTEWKDFLLREEESFFHFSRAIPQIVFQQAYNTLYHPTISTKAKKLEDNGDAPKTPWFRMYEMEPPSSPYKPPLVFRKPVQDERKTGYQDLTALIVVNHERIVSGYLDGSLAIWDVRTGNRLHYFKAHSWMIHCLISLGGKTFASGGDDGIIKIWDVNTGGIVRELTGHTSKILCMEKLNDDFLISGSADTTVRIWDIRETNAESKVLSGHSGPVVGLTLFKPNNLITVSMDNTFRFWNVSKGKLLGFTEKYTGNAEHSITESPDGGIYSHGVSGLIFWGNKNDLFKSPILSFLFKSARVILPVENINTHSMDCDSCIWVSKNEILVSSHNKIVKINVMEDRETVVVDNPDPDCDFHLGLFKIDSNTMLSWNQNGSIWRWDLQVMERTRIAMLPRGRPDVVVQLNEC